ncbi:toxin glutamine deamidase domain-containing protein, partial [Streptomyces ziwulingensis]|uniref:toxin glutamine deamidase domain-containing protein n=1 Tax=Streptomyces ziwulingensis TaxID=1045501 RepID=UPI0031EAEA02
NTSPHPPAADPTTPQPPGSPTPDPGSAQHQNHPHQDSLEDIRADLDHHPGGLTPPDPTDQQALTDAVPHSPDGTPQRFPDPFGPWTQLQNDGGNQVPGRSNNCADCSRSFLETWYGNPQVSAPRTPDTDAQGNPDPWSPESNANDNQIRWTGASHTYAGPGGDPATADTIADTLRQAGPGSAAIVQVDWPGGGGHAYNAVNHNGDIIWIDTQSGQVSHQPLHIDQAAHVWHIPLDADRNPIDTTQPATSTSTSTSTSTNQQGSQSSGQHTQGTPGSTTPGNDGTPHNGVPGEAPKRADAGATDATSKRDKNRDATPADADGTGGAPPLRDGTHREESGDPTKPSVSRDAGLRHMPGEVDGSERGREAPSAGAIPDRPAQPTGTDTPEQPGHGQGDEAKYTDPHDRGESDTSDESRRVTENGPDSDVSRTHATPETETSREYGLEPDDLQQDLRDRRDVFRVELDRVHARLDHWAESGDLTRVLRATSGDGPHPAPEGPHRFTRDQLTSSLPGFDRLSRGEQQAVVASLARLSLAFHQQHSVGRSPERIDHPYRNENEGDPAPGTADRGAKLSRESLGVRLHRMAMNAMFKKAEFKNLLPDEVSTLRRQGPDFSGKNYAVLEVQGPPPDHEVEYIVDSSVPANQKLPGVQPRHSERHLLDWVKRMDPDGTKYKPLGLYTEREPCGQGQGHAKCSVALQDSLLENVPIHYSTTYRDDPIGVNSREQMAKDKRSTLASLTGMSDQDIRQRMQDEWSERFKDDEKRLNRAFKRIEGESGASLINAIAKELDAQRKETRTDEEDAIGEEFNRHMDALAGTWSTLRGQLLD